MPKLYHIPKNRVTYNRLKADKRKNSQDMRSDLAFSLNILR